MNKLQLYMTMSKKGVFAPKLDINPDSHVRAWVTDLHDQVCQVGYPTAQRKIFYMIKYIDTGFFIVVIRTIPGQTHGDHLASWIYAPYSLRITHEQISQTVRFITERVSASDIRTSDVAAMRERFDLSYDEDPLAPVFAPSDGQTTAYRYYGEAAAIDELVGRYRYQTSYLPYDAVLLIDREIAEDVAGDDLTMAPLDDMGVLMPPDDDAMGRTPYIYDQPLDAPYYIPMMRPVDIIWRKEGEEDAVTTVIAERHITQCPAAPIQSHPEPTLPSAPSDLSEPTETAEPAEPAEPAESAESSESSEPTEPAEPSESFEPKNLWDPSESAETSESESKSAAVSDLPRRNNTYYFQMPAKKASIGSVIEFEISTPTALNESPLEGYEPTGTIREGALYRNHLVYAGGNSRSALVNQIIWGVAGFLIGACLIWLCTCGGSAKDATPAAEGETEQALQTAAEPETPTEGAQALPEAQGEKQTDTSEKAAILYLDTHDKWKKAELEQYPDLIGLYDDLNNYNHERIINTWGVKLKESRNFKNIANHAQMAHNAHKKPKPLSGGSTYNKPNDTVITVRTYLNTIDP